MSFEAKIPDHLKELQAKLRTLKSERLDMYHDCECEYCEYDGLRDFVTEEDVEAKDAEIKEVEETIARVERFAKDRGVEVPA